MLHTQHYDVIRMVVGQEGLEELVMESDIDFDPEREVYGSHYGLKRPHIYLDMNMLMDEDIEGIAKHITHEIRERIFVLSNLTQNEINEIEKSPKDRDLATNDRIPGLTNWHGSSNLCISCHIPHIPRYLFVSCQVGSERVCKTQVAQRWPEFR